MKQLLLIISSICLFSCGHRTRPECKNDNPAFDLYDPISNDYKRELAAQLQSRDKHTIHYWIDKYIEIDKKPFMTVYVQAEGALRQGVHRYQEPQQDAEVQERKRDIVYRQRDHRLSVRHRHHRRQATLPV